MGLWWNPWLQNGIHSWKKKGINGSSLASFNVGINKFISNERKEAAAEVIKFLTSREVQKEIIIKKFKYFSGISSLYDDKEVCSIFDCKIIKETQWYIRPSVIRNEYDSYKAKIVNNFNEFLYNNKSAEEVLTNIIDIFKPKYFSIYSSNIALIYFIALIIALYFVFSTNIALFIPKCKKYFKFFTLNNWIIYSLGSLLIILSSFFYYGEVKVYKCYLNFAMLTIGITMNYSPILCKLISNFPMENKYSIWVIKNNFYCILLINIIQIILNSLLYSQPPFEVVNKKLNINDNIYSYDKCVNKKYLFYYNNIFNNINNITYIYKYLFFNFFGMEHQRILLSNKKDITYCYYKFNFNYNIYHYKYWKFRNKLYFI